MLNNLTIMGRITHDLELKTTPNGVEVVSFSIACDRNYKNRTMRSTPSSSASERTLKPEGLKQDDTYPTDFFNVVAWRKTAEFIGKHFQKGAMIALKGSLQSRKYTDKEGKERTVVEILADSVYFCGGKKQEDGNGNAPAAPVTTAPPLSNGNGMDFVPDFSSNDADDDYPF